MANNNNNNRNLFRSLKGELELNEEGVVVRGQDIPLRNSVLHLILSQNLRLEDDFEGVDPPSVLLLDLKHLSKVSTPDHLQQPKVIQTQGRDLSTRRRRKKKKKKKGGKAIFG